MQKLRYLNAAAVDCVDRLLLERDKRNDVSLRIHGEKEYVKGGYCLSFELRFGVAIVVICGLIPLWRQNRHIFAGDVLAGLRGRR